MEIYRRTLLCLQQGDCGLQQQILTYNCKTECVKNVFLFFYEFSAGVLNVGPSKIIVGPRSLTVFLETFFTSNNKYFYSSY